MKIQINEVWNNNGRSLKLAEIEVTNPAIARTQVNMWIRANRPDLSVATGLYQHGFHAVAVQP